jgi:hypothetical protein
LPDPLERLRFYITETLKRLHENVKDAATTRFIVATRWRLHHEFPEELAEAEKPFVDLLRDEVIAATDAGPNVKEPIGIRGSSLNSSGRCITTTHSPLAPRVS